MPRIETYIKDDKITDDDVFLGTDFRDSNKTKNFKAFRVAEYVTEKITSNDLDRFVTQNNDLTNTNFYYWGGILTSGEWRINRYDKTDVNVQTTAKEQENGSFTNYTDAWVNRYLLTYI